MSVVPTTATQGAYAFYTLDATTLSVTVSSNDSDLQGLAIGLFQDRDGDGQHDYQDLDSDNDGISDLQESGNAAAIVLDADSNGTIERNEAGAAGTDDADNDGLLDIFDGNDANTDALVSAGTIAPDTDSDGKQDFIDLDSDGDGIADAIEAMPTAGYTSITSTADADGDGVIDAFEAGASAGTFGGTFNAPNADSDDTADTLPDYIDTDSDGDSTPDASESGLTLSGTDANDDGIDDDASIGASYADPDGTFTPLATLTNSDNDAADVDYRSIQDTDGDGISDSADIDDDNDGIIDELEYRLHSGNLSTLTNTDTSITGVPAANTKSANEVVGTVDGIGFTVSNDTTMVLFHNGTNVQVGGVSGATVTSSRLTIAFDQPIQSLSLDFGSMSSAETLSNFNIDPVTVSAGLALSSGSVSGPSAAAGTVTWLDLAGATSISFDYNKSGDAGITVTGFTARTETDTDSDGIDDHFDLDSDNDGISDLEEAGHDVSITDANNDGVIDSVADVAAAGTGDVDRDGLADSVEAIEGPDSGVTPRQTDGDGIADYLDLDSDDDGISDNL